MELEHPYTAIVVNNEPELHYVLKWAEGKNKRVAPYMYEVKKFPYCLFPASDILGWTDLMDRNVHYETFENFIKETK